MLRRVSARRRLLWYNKEYACFFPSLFISWVEEIKVNAMLVEWRASFSASMWGPSHVYITEAICLYSRRYWTQYPAFGKARLGLLLWAGLSQGCRPKPEGRRINAHDPIPQQK